MQHLLGVYIVTRDRETMSSYRLHALSMQPPVLLLLHFYCAPQKFPLPSACSAQLSSARLYGCTIYICSLWDVCKLNQQVRWGHIGAIGLRCTDTLECAAAAAALLQLPQGQAVSLEKSSPEWRSPMFASVPITLNYSSPISIWKAERLAGSYFWNRTLIATARRWVSRGH